MGSGTKNNTRAKQKKQGMSKFYIIVTAAIVISTLFSLYVSASDMRKMKYERGELQAMILDEEQKQAELNSQKHYFESDSFIEKTAREKLGLVKPSDVVFIDRNAHN